MALLRSIGGAFYAASVALREGFYAASVALREALLIPVVMTYRSPVGATFAYGNRNTPAPLGPSSAHRALNAELNDDLNKGVEANVECAPRTSHDLSRECDCFCEGF